MTDSAGLRQRKAAVASSSSSSATRDASNVRGTDDEAEHESASSRRTSITSIPIKEREAPLSRGRSVLTVLLFLVILVPLHCGQLLFYPLSFVPGQFSCGLLALAFQSSP
ncbi:BZ3500_MvSof-1268-A1-R1_Chr7-1g09361 [Microbotryum saponariae]|uniref:BZ3500_MvSof-1268-A1-R1_Chr7-1g09361 protein n=1 Tax=Microbotryum saponariae TaxID=289078 RepID=A0A2X0L909_9BASI|nr:BZ3501_MvSof-1269-A2-R1_Chr7-1g09066 [Microbotryum saponariae]SDA03294.1 BZ3500_MvSof-1268-A1-R1_Chr7-1g09361 [Microbotryum saponariae]